MALWGRALAHAPVCTTLAESDVEPYALAELLQIADDECRELWHGLGLGYTQALGHPLLRAEIARLYESVDQDGVLVAAGGDETIAGVLSTLVGPEDHAIVLLPAYAGLIRGARASGAAISFVQLDAADGWSLDLDLVRRALRPRTRAIVVNTPHNPTGSTLGRAAFSELVALAEDAGAHLLCDEVYRFLEREESERLPAAADGSATAISLGSMSKAFALAGLRVGWIATRDRSLLARVARRRGELSGAASAPAEVLALIALRARETVLARSRRIVEANVGRLGELAQRRPELVDWALPNAGPVCFPQLRRGLSADRLAAALLVHEQLAVLPGSAFGLPGSCFRIGLGRTEAPAALDRLERCLARPDLVALAA